MSTIEVVTGLTSDPKARAIHQLAPSASIPLGSAARGWTDIFWRVYRHISECRLIAISASVAFYTLLAIFPAIAALVSIYGLFADPASISTHLDALANIAPVGAIDIIRDETTRLAQQGTATLGVSFFVGLCLSLWSANAGVKALFNALNVVYGEKEKRSFIELNAVTLAFTAGGIVFLLVALAAIVGIPIALNYIGLVGATELVVTTARWPVLFGCMSLAIACIYSSGPSREMPRWRWFTWGSTFAAIAWISASVLFSWYVANFGSYNKTYGSLGAAIGFMTWIWISVIVILVGAEIDAEMEHYRRGNRDETRNS